MTISAVIITFNEEDRITKCLESLQWVDEIIIVDSYSTDNTVSLCKNFTNQVYQRNFKSYGDQKRYALTKASSNWVLSIDADEVISEPLKKRIIALLEHDPSYQAFEIQRKMVFLNKVLNFTFGREYKLRLFKKDQARIIGDIHETITVSGPTARIDEIMYHYSHRDISHVLLKVNQYSSQSALQIKHSNYGISRCIFRGLFAFIRHYFIKLGFLDGVPGFICCIGIAEGTYYKYLKNIYKY